MNNYEKIKNMSIDEMAEFIMNLYCRGHGTKIYYSNITKENIKRFRELLNRKKGYSYA